MQDVGHMHFEKVKKQKKIMNVLYPLALALVLEQVLRPTDLTITKGGIACLSNSLG